MALEVQNGGANGGESKAVTFSALKPQLFVQAPKASDALQFYKAAFGAEEVSRTMHPKRKADQEQPLILSAQVKLGSTAFLVSDVVDDSVSQAKPEGVVFAFCLETEDVEAALSKAVAAGAVQDGEITEGEGPCCGGRVGKVADPYGFTWVICSPAKECVDVDA
ncbi:uncharacterized protein At5g48480 [Malania oleifera]|uniref:uncharacterized protein At5g48480 n=1 Tax=Malania oleifera TaxID=397392 RepID=UPI0025AE6473|nr:uncharacterized protein At5g48480 [Malania oleifera]